MTDSNRRNAGGQPPGCPDQALSLLRATEAAADLLAALTVFALELREAGGPAAVVPALLGPLNELMAVVEEVGPIVRQLEAERDGDVGAMTYILPQRRMLS